MDNIDHNPCATTAKDSFHGTGISSIQHLIFADEGVDHGIVILEANGESKHVHPLPHFYSDVPPVTSSVKQSAVP